MTRLNKLLRKQLDKAINDFGLIVNGDRILVGVSGGPDSLSLLQLLHERQQFGNISFSIIPAHVDLGFEQEGVPSWQTLQDHANNLGMEIKIVHTKIQEIMLDPNAKKKPCFICSHNRRRIYVGFGL